MTYPFGVWVKKPNTDGAGANGAWHLKPTDGNLLVNMKSPAEQGCTYDIELGRLKVLTGAPENVGKYYVYLKVNDQLIQSTYFAVNSDGSYLSSSATCHLSNEIIFTDWGSYGNKISSIPVTETYDSYDEVYYTDLKKDGKQLDVNGFTFAGGNLFTYDATSPSYSAILRFRWTAGSDTGIQFSFDKSGTSGSGMSYPFGVWVKKPNDNGAGVNGAWHLKPTDGNLLVNMKSPANEGNTYDIELGRLKVKTGAPENVGKYYVYLKVNDQLIQSTYFGVNSDGSYLSSSTTCHISNEIVFNDWSSYGNKISSTPIPETFEDYDEIYYSDLSLNGVALGSETDLSGATVLKYNSTSPTGSAMLKYRWTVGDIPKFQLSFEKASSTAIEYMFGAWLEPNDSYPNGKMWFRPGYGTEKNLPSALEAGSTHDIEFARLKVKTGANKGKYYVYLKIDGVTIDETYVSANVVGSDGNYTTNPNSTVCNVKSGEIIMTYWGSSGNKISAIPFTEEYEDYDEIRYSDLLVKDIPVESETYLSGSNLFGYVPTSPTGSAVLKYRWTVGDIPKFQLSFEKSSSSAIEYTFGAWLEPNDKYPNGKMWLRPSYGTEKNLPFALSPGSSHNVEFARLKVKNGPNKGRYHLYLKIDDVLIDEAYIAASVVDSNGDYTTSPNATVCNVKDGEIVMTYWGSNGNMISEYHDGTDKGDFDKDGLLNATDLSKMVNILLGVEDLTDEILEIADFNNDEIVNVVDLVLMKRALSDAADKLEMISMQIGSNPTERTFVWYSTLDVEGKVQLALKSDMVGKAFPSKYNEFTAVLSEAVTSNKKTNTVKVTGLAENTEYVYRLGTSAHWSPIYSFKTQDFDSGSFSFLAVGDPQIGMKVLQTDRAVWNDTLTKGFAKNPNASFLLSLGDQVDSCTNEGQYSAVFSPDVLKSLPIAAVVGNHDYPSKNYSIHFKMPNVSEYGVSEEAGSGSGDYWYIYDNTLFMSLNTNITDVSQHRQFMTEAMAANPNVKWKIVTMHQTLYSTANVPAATIPLRNDLSPIFSELGIDVVLSAHDHSYTRTYMMNGTTPVVPEGGVPSSVTNPGKGQVLYVSLNSSSSSLHCSQVSGDYPYCAVKNQENVANISSVSITDTSFKITTYRTNDMTVVDEFTINKGN